jgi:transposase-like protein
MSVGRPSSYTREIADLICERLANGESLREICRDAEMPSLSMVFRWINQHIEFREQYARARETQADVLADEIIDIADNASNDWMEKNFKGQTQWVENGEAIRRSQLRVDSRKWVAAKMKPKKYGDKTIHSGDPENPVSMIITGVPRPGDASG